MRECRICLAFFVSLRTSWTSFPSITSVTSLSSSVSESYSCGKNQQKKKKLLIGCNLLHTRTFPHSTLKLPVSSSINRWKMVRFFLRTRRENCTQIVLIMWKKIAFSLEFEFIKLVREQVKIYILLAWLAVLSFARRINIFQQITVLWATRLMSNWHANACGSSTPKTLRRSNALLSAQQKLSLMGNFGGGGGRALI